VEGAKRPGDENQTIVLSKGISSVVKVYSILHRSDRLRRSSSFLPSKRYKGSCDLRGPALSGKKVEL
jgi:hypothetical protein